MYCTSLYQPSTSPALSRRLKQLPLRLCLFDMCKKVNDKLTINDCSKTYLLTYLLIYLLTSSEEQSPSSEANRCSPSQKIPPFYGTRKFITTFSSSRYLSLLSHINPVQAPLFLTSYRSIFIFSSHLRLRLQGGSFPLVSQPKPCTHLYSPHKCYMPRPSHSSRFDHRNNTG